MLVCSGDRDTHPARQRRHHAAVPERAGGLPAQALRPRRGHRALRRRAASSTPTSPRSSARPATTCPASTRSARRPRSSGSTQFGGLDALLDHADKVTGVVGSNLRDQHDDVRAQPHAQPPVRDVELPVGPPISRCSRMDAQAVRDIFARLEFKTLIPRVAELAGDRAADGRRDPDRAAGCGCEPSAGAGARRRRRSRTGSRATAEGTRSIALRAAHQHGGLTGVRLRDGRCRRVGAVDVRRVPTTPIWSLAGRRRAEDRSATPSRRSRRCGASGLGSAASRSTRSSRAGCSGPSFPTRPSPTWSTATSTRSCPRPTRPARARDRGRDPGAAGLVHAPGRGRPARELARRASLRCSRDIELPTRPGARRHGAAGVTVNHATLQKLVERPRRPRRRARAAGVRDDRPRGEPRLAEAAAGGAVRRARHAEDPQDQDRVLDGCRSRSPTCRTSTRIRSSTCCCSTARRRSCADHRVARHGDRRATTACTPPTCRPADQTGRISSQRPEPAEHPDQDGGEPPHPRRLRGTATATRPCSPPTTRRSRCASWRTSPEIPGLIEAFNSGEDLHRFVGATGVRGRPGAT